MKNVFWIRGQRQASYLITCLLYALYIPTISFVFNLDYSVGNFRPTNPGTQRGIGTFPVLVEPQRVT
jgi:hypothetical protein